MTGTVGYRAKMCVDALETSLWESSSRQRRRQEMCLARLDIDMHMQTTDTTFLVGNQVIARALEVGSLLGMRWLTGCSELGIVIVRLFPPMSLASVATHCAVLERYILCDGDRT